jgi:hypothetical protein
MKIGNLIKPDYDLTEIKKLMSEHQNRVEEELKAPKEEKKEPEFTYDDVKFLVSPIGKTGHFLKKVWVWLVD